MREFARRAQDIAQSIVGVRVIHYHQEGLAFVDSLAAARDRFQIFDPLLDFFERDAIGDGGCGRRQDVGQIDPAQKR